MRYRDFNIEIGAQTTQGLALHVESPAGPGRGFFDDTLGAHRHVVVPERGEVPEPTPQEQGQRLFDGLFRGSVRQLFDQSWGLVKNSEAEEGLRVQIRFDPAESSSSLLAAQPWELLFRQDTQEFLCLSRKTPVSRQLVTPHPPRPLSLASPMRILAVKANPAGSVPLALNREHLALEAALQEAGAVNVDFEAVSTAAELRRVLLRERYPVVHFMGHGDFASGEGTGWLLFEDEAGGTDELPGGHLANELRDLPFLQLVLLNACSTGSWGGENPFAGVVAALMLAGVPAVVAMREPISDRAAIIFSSELYRRLGAGDPLDAAVAEGRLAVSRLDRTRVEWSIPVLYLRPGGGTAAAPTRDRGLAASGNGSQDPLRVGSPRPRAHTRILWGWGAALLSAVLGLVLYAIASGRGFIPSEESPVDPGQVGASATESGSLESQADSVPRQPQPASVDAALPLSTLQEPPYRREEVRLYLLLPTDSSPDTSSWRSQVERAMSRKLASLGLRLTPTSNASWLAVLSFHSPEVSQEVSGPASVCEVRADYKLIHQQEQRGPLRTLAERVSQLSTARACEAAVQRVAERAGADVVSAYVGD